MKKIIMVKYAELTTKKDNRSYFINTLVKNIESALSELCPVVTKDYYRMFVSVSDEFLKEALDRLTKIFGILEVALCYFDEDKTIDNICLLSKLVIEENSTFKVVTNRSDKEYPIKSMDVSRKVGGFLLKNVSDLKVDVHNPNILVNVEIRKEGVYVYGNSLKSGGGYPTGTLGKAILMLSGGLDSVVAGYLTMKRGVKLDFLYFESLPHTSLEARNKVVELAKVLKKYGNNGKLYVVPFTKIQETIYRDMDNTYMITIMRRMMYRIGEKVSKKIGSLAIVNGESIGQVASQTLTSIKVVNDVTNYPIIRPLASFDKVEIMDIARKIGSYDISILPYEDCCTIFVPPHPVINPSLEHARKQEENFDFSLIDEAIKDILIIDLEEKKNENTYL